MLKKLTVNENFHALVNPSFWLLVLVTVSGLTTTNISMEIVGIIRLVAAAVVILVVVLTMIRVRHPKIMIIPVGIYFVASFYAMIVAIIAGGVMDYKSIVIDIGLTVCAIVIFGERFNGFGRALQDEIAPWFVIYGIVGLLLTYAVGGIVFDYPPQFIFEVGSEQIGREETYSLLLTGFFSYASISSAVGVLRAKSRIGSVAFGLLMLLFIYLSVLAGGRGELVAAVFVILLAFYFDRRFRKFALLLLGVLTGYLLIGGASEIFYDFAPLARFSSLFEGDYSYRDMLLKQAVDLLLNEPKCILLGCGPGYFQAYYGHDFDLYPHNYFAEAVIIFGFPIATIGIGFMIRGAISYYRRVRELDLFLLVFLYNIVVALKSGYFFGSWILNAGIVFLIALGFVGKPIIRRPAC